MGQKHWKISKTGKEIFSLKVLTRTCGSISGKSTVASTSERSFCVGTCCIWMTIMGCKCTFIVVCINKREFIVKVFYREKAYEEEWDKSIEK